MLTCVVCLADTFAIQSEIATSIAGQLQTRLSASEKNAIEQAPTNDITALDLYSHAENLLLTTFSSVASAKLLEVVDLLNQAVARDPSFFQAYCRLVNAHDRLYSLGLDHTAARLALAEEAVQAAFRLRPNAGETHLARAEILYQGHFDRVALKDRKEEPKTIGEKLGVSTLLEGTMRKQGNRVRIVAALTNAADGIELWTRTFDRELKDIFAFKRK